MEGRIYLRRKSEKRKTGLKLLFVVVLVMCSVLTYSKGRAEQKEQELEKKKTAYEQQKKAEQELQEQLKETEAYQQTTQYVEEQARGMGLVYPDEIILREESAE